VSFKSNNLVVVLIQVYHERCRNYLMDGHLVEPGKLSVYPLGQGSVAYSWVGR